MARDNPTVLIKGGGEIASGVAHRLFRCNFRVCMTEIARPTTVRREVSFSEAIFEGKKTVEGLTAKLVDSYHQIPELWDLGMMPIVIDPEANVRDYIKPAILVDAIMAKRNLGTRITDALLVMGLGPGFRAGKDVHLVVETNRGHNLGRVISEGEAQENTGVPGNIAGYSIERVLRATKDGTLTTLRNIGDYVDSGGTVALVDDSPIRTEIQGVIRGLLRNGSQVFRGMKAGDIDPRGIREYCCTISDKARAIGGGVLEGILTQFNV
jgi:xanthine dehydrogenase accessory factor